MFTTHKLLKSFCQFSANLDEKLSENAKWKNLLHHHVDAIRIALVSSENYVLVKVSHLHNGVWVKLNGHHHCARLRYSVHHHSHAHSLCLDHKYLGWFCVLLLKRKQNGYGYANVIPNVSATTCCDLLRRCGSDCASNCFRRFNNKNKLVNENNIRIYKNVTMWSYISYCIGIKNYCRF